MAESATIPDRTDRRPRPARAEAAAIVATTVKARPAEIVPVAIVPVITWDWIDIPRAPVAARHAQNRRFLGVTWKAVIRWLMIARQEAVAVPAWRRPFMSRRIRRDDRQQRQDDSNRQKHETRHEHTIDGRLLRGDSNLSAQASATASGSLAKRPLWARSGRSRVSESREQFDQEHTFRECPNHVVSDYFYHYEKLILIGFFRRGGKPNRKSYFFTPRALAHGVHDHARICHSGSRVCDL